MISITMSLIWIRPLNPIEQHHIKYMIVCNIALASHGDLSKILLEPACPCEIQIFKMSYLLCC